MERNVELGQAALLRGAVATVKTAHGKAPRLQVSTPAQADLHRRRKEDADLRVQVSHASASPRNAPALVSRRRPRDGLPVTRSVGHARWSTAYRLRRWSLGETLGLATRVPPQRRGWTELGPRLVLLPPGQS